MREYWQILIYFLVLGVSCTSSKNVMRSEGNLNDAVHIAIDDFLNSVTLSKEDSVFSIRTEDLTSRVLGISILGDPNTRLFTPKVKIGSTHPTFPTAYLEQEGKFFFWNEPSKVVTSDVLEALLRHDKMDTVVIYTDVPRMLVSSDKRGIHYYFCKSNFAIFKKVETSVALGWQKPPRLKCK